ncbi:PREDICTED: uncharacterized protein LOC109227632 [Nicotiana attenuata]|uniref:uncharacterized protein LOC109227632 n=1 Tax=Nicotiana attenuata TaxID=49451 RepID=UPI000904A863|nr:PREDICTED: uncharacterized protein LOC109227632 [Nicotiana attenuata]
MCSPKSCGGLNLVNIHIWNRAAIAKICWDVEAKQDRLWIKWIRSYYIKGQQFMQMPAPKKACWMLRQIFNARADHNLVQRNKQVTITTRHIYFQLLGQQTRVPWKCLIFQNCARSKAQYTMWMLLHGRLPTTDRLIKWGLTVDTQCSLCHNHEENRDHLFVVCDFARNIWMKLMQWMQHDYIRKHNWEQHMGWSIQHAKGKTTKARIFRLVYAEIVHAIWIGRNLRIFEKRARDWNSIAREIAYTCTVRATASIQNFYRANDSSDELIEKTVELEKADESRMAALARMEASEEVIRVLRSGRAIQPKMPFLILLLIWNATLAAYS